MLTPAEFSGSVLWPGGRGGNLSLNKQNGLKLNILLQKMLYYNL